MSTKGKNESGLRAFLLPWVTDCDECWKQVLRVQKLESSAATRLASVPECFALICGKRRHHMKPTVQRLGIHLPNQKIVLTSCAGDDMNTVDLPSDHKDFSVARTNRHSKI
jgi:hypothetical protein